MLLIDAGPMGTGLMLLDCLLGTVVGCGHVVREAPAFKAVNSTSSRLRFIGRSAEDGGTFYESDGQEVGRSSRDVDLATCQS